MNLKPHIPLAAGVLVIVLTQVFCAWWIASTIERTSVDQAAVYNIEQSLDRIAEHVAPQ